MRPEEFTISRLTCKTLFVYTTGLLLAPCGTTGKHKFHRPQTTARAVQPVRISHIDRTQGSQELVLRSLGLIGTPYRWGDNITATGFGCSGVIQYIHKNTFNVNLSRTTRDMATASRKVPDDKLKAGDLAVFNTDGAHTYSHVGLYIGNGKFIHTPSSGKTIKAEKPSTPFYAKNYLGAHTSFTEQIKVIWKAS